MLGTNGQTITLSDLPQNYKKIEVLVGAVGYDREIKKYYYPYLDTITFYPNSSNNTELYAHKASNAFGTDFLRWQVDFSVDTNEIHAYTHQTAGQYWQGMFIKAIYGYK